MGLDAIISLQKHTIDGLRADLTRVTAERDEIKGLLSRTGSALVDSTADLAQLRAEQPPTP